MSTQKATPGPPRAKVLAVSAGPRRRLNQGVNSPRRPNSQKSYAPLAKSKNTIGLGPVKKVAFDTSRKQAVSSTAVPGSSGKLSVEQVLKQLSCTNEKMLDDVVASVTKSNPSAGALGRRTPLNRSRLSEKKLPGDMLLESFNSLAFKQHMQKGRQASAGKNDRGRSGQLMPLKTKIEKPKSPRIVHRASSVGPCKCKACITKRNEHEPDKSQANFFAKASSAKNQPPTQNAVGDLRAKANPTFKRPPLEKAASLPLTKTPLNSKPSLSAAASNKIENQNQKKIELSLSRNETPTKSNDFSNKKPFAFLQTLFKTNTEAGDKTDNGADKGKGIDKDQAADPKNQENGKTSGTFDLKRLSTVREETQDAASQPQRRHSDNLSGSISLDEHADDVESVVSYPFPRPRTGSTCCQSFQFMEVMTGWVPNVDGATKKSNRKTDFEPFGMFDPIDGGNFINLKEDVAKTKQIIKSRIGVRSQNKPETSIQWKRGPILGRGAFGTVWCGLTMAGEMVAVKQAEISSIDLQKAQKEYEKIQQEVDLLKSLSHKNIVGYLGTSLEDRIVSIFMQFIPGGSLTSVLKKFGALAESVVACYTKQILEGVEYLHSKNVVHRDIKGSNVMLMPNAVIKLIDFGCAKRAINLTKSSEEILKSMKGTPFWMAPEVINETGHGKKSDIWSVGCTVFEMATSRPPWSHLNRYAALLTIANGTAASPEMPERFSQEAKRFVSECMTREPDKRPDATISLNSPFLLQHGQKSVNKRMLDSRGVPLNSTKRQ